MLQIETNVFRIKNLAELSTSYRLYRIRGVQSDHPEYFRNRDLVARRLSYQLRSSATVIDRHNEPHLVLSHESETPPNSLNLVRTTAYFDEVPGTFEVDFS